MDERDRAAGAAELELLAAALDGQRYAVSLVIDGEHRPHLAITNRRATQATENVYSDGTHFYWGWAASIAPVTDVTAAAAAIDRVLRIFGGNR